MFGNGKTLFCFKKCHEEKKKLSDFKNTIRGDDSLLMKRKKLRLTKRTQYLLRGKMRKLKRRKRREHVHLQNSYGTNLKKIKEQ